MALSLSAEQKSIEEIFYTNDQYIIPDYQRPYSWGFEQCNQMYMDFYNAFTNESDYFIGNIIIAKSQNDRKRPQVVDGQQRLITIWLLLKTLSVLCPNLTINDKLLTIPSMRRDSDALLRIQSNVFEVDDDNQLKVIFKYTSADFLKRLNSASDSKGMVQEELCCSNFEYAALLFFLYLHGIEENRLTAFTEFILDHVFLLPIELSGSDMEDALNKALTIFETINNRGMSLENADIFKAKLYSKSMECQAEEAFKSQWADFRQSVECLGLTIDDIFRYYSHIIRGRENITFTEKNLRDFFLLDAASPLFKNSYKTTMDELSHIVDVLQKMETLMHGDALLGPWLQLIDIYSNNYPKYVVVSYLFIQEHLNSSQMLRMLRSLVRYVYGFGATTTVKFEIYRMIGRIFQNQLIDDYFLEEHSIDITRYRMLRKGYALLFHYLKGGPLLQNYKFDKLLTKGDLLELKQLSWPDEGAHAALTSLANTFVIDIPLKRKKRAQKYDYYAQNMEHTQSASSFYKSSCTYEDFKRYEADYIETLNSFFIQS